MGKVFGKESQYPDAGRRWTSLDEEVLKSYFLQNLLMDELVALIGRGPGGILLRLKKLELIEEDVDLKDFDNSIKVRLTQLNSGQDEAIIYRQKLKILEKWELANWKLENDQRQRFLNHPTLFRLIKLNQDVVFYAISNLGLIKLDEIFGYVHGKSLEEKDSQTIQKDINRIKRVVVNKIARELKIERQSSPINTSTERLARGKSSFGKFGMINPPPAEVPDLRHTSVHNCSICNKPVVGNSCACDGW